MPAIWTPLREPHLLDSERLSREEIHSLFKAARAFAKAGGSVPLLDKKTVVNLFFENSTRTRTSFELAARRLGAQVVNFASSSSSLSKGETLLDTARNIGAMNAHCLVVRHSAAGAPRLLAEKAGLPVINAGDGFHEHPTQALLDAFTLEEKLGSLEGKRIVILGDIAHSRVAHSNLRVLRTLGASVAVSGPPSLLPRHLKELGIEVSHRPEAVLAGADAVMALRIQMERHNRMELPSLSEYAKIWGLNPERAALLKPSAVVLHPGPINRGVELTSEVADGPRSVILEQVSNGIAIRMGVLAAVCAPEALKEWVKA